MKFKHCFMASCFLLLTTTASFAEVRELDSYTVDLPAQWDVEQQGQFWESYTAPGSSDLVHLVRGDYLFSDALLLARSLAARSRAGDSLRIMEDGRTFSFVKPNGDRVVLLESGGKTVMVTVVERHKRIPELLLGFTSRDPKLTKIFTALADTRMIDWLSFTSDVQPGADLHPAKARGMPDFSTYGTIEGEKGNPPPPTEEMPSDWEHKAIGLWTVAVAKDSEEWVAARFITLPETLKEIAREIATRFNGRNIVVVEEGFLLFGTIYGNASLNGRGENRILHLYGGARQQ